MIEQGGLIELLHNRYVKEDEDIQRITVHVNCGTEINLVNIYSSLQDAMSFQNVYRPQNYANQCTDRKLFICLLPTALQP